MSKLTELCKHSKHLLKVKAPSILTITGLLGIVAMAFLIADAAPTVKEEETVLKQKQGVKTLPIKDEAEIYIRNYWPAALVGIGAGLCFVYSNTIHIRRTESLTAAYAVSRDAYDRYRAKVKEESEQRDIDILDSIAKDRMTETGYNDDTVVETGNGNTLFYDPLSGRYFHCSIEKVRRAEVALNKLLFSDGYVNLNTFYDEIGLKNTSLGDNLGWILDNTKDFVSIRFSAQITEKEQPCIALDYEVGPTYDFRDY